MECMPDVHGRLRRNCVTKSKRFVLSAAYETACIRISLTAEVKGVVFNVNLTEYLV